MAITDSNGTLTSQQRYLPFGGTRTNVTAPNSPGTDFGYTGQRQLDAGMGGLMDYKARFYSPYINRFIQPDSVIPDANNPQAWNRYSYVGNRPINLNDPTGHCPTCLIGAAVGAIAGAFIYAGTTWSSGREWNNNDYLASVAVGALGGLLIGTGVGAGAGIATFAAIGAGAGAIGGQAGYSISSGKGYDSEEMVISAGVGAAAGAVSGAVTGGTGLMVTGASSQVIASATTNVMITNAAINGSAGLAQYELMSRYNHSNTTLEGRGAAFGSGAVSSLLLDGIFGGSVVSSSAKIMTATNNPYYKLMVGGSPFRLPKTLFKEGSTQLLRNVITDPVSRKLERLLGD